MNRRQFIQRGALFVPMIFVPRLLRAQTVIQGPPKMPLVGGGGGGGDAPFITGVSGGTPQAAFTFLAGFQFTLTQNITITSLGRLVLSGNSNTHLIYLLETNGTILTSQTVPTSGLTANTFSQVSISPFSAPIGTYYLMSTETAAGDTWMNDDATITIGVPGTVGQSSFAASTGVTPSINNSGSRALGIPNFLWH